MILKGYTDEQINKIMAHYGRKMIVHLWGDDYEIEPEIIENVQGDGLQAVYLQPLDTRPNFYVLRIDSSIDIDNDNLLFEGTDNEIDICEMLLQMVEAEHDTIEDYEEVCTDGKETMYHYIHEEDEKPKTWDEVCFPTLHWSGGSWGAMYDVSDILN